MDIGVSLSCLRWPRHERWVCRRCPAARPLSMRTPQSSLHPDPWRSSAGGPSRAQPRWRDGPEQSVFRLPPGTLQFIRRMRARRSANEDDRPGARTKPAWTSCLADHSACLKALGRRCPADSSVQFAFRGQPHLWSGKAESLTLPSLLRGSQTIFGKMKSQCLPFHGLCMNLELV